MLEEAREDLVLGDNRAVDAAIGSLMGVDGQVQVEGQACACVSDELALCLSRIRLRPPAVPASRPSAGHPAPMS